jgi:drug/metabolite transporter (DMT)-like permease
MVIVFIWLFLWFHSRYISSQKITMTTRTRAEAILLAMTVIWGSTFVVVKLGLTDISPVFYTSLRFLLSCVIFLPLFYKKIFPIPSAAWKKGLILGFFLLAGFVTQVIGLNITTASKSGFITGTLVVFTPLLQIFIEKKLPRLGNFIGVALVTIGLFLLTSPAGSQFNFGDFLTLCCAILYALYIIYLDMYSDEKAEVLTFLQFFFVGVGGLLYTFFAEDIVFHFTTPSLLSLGYTCLFATLLTTFIQTKYQKQTTPTRAAIIFSIEPVISACLAYLILCERIGAIGIAGGALIIVGILISETSDVWGRGKK